MKPDKGHRHVNSAGHESLDDADVALARVLAEARLLDDTPEPGRAFAAELWEDLMGGATNHRPTARPQLVRTSPEPNAFRSSSIRATRSVDWASSRLSGVAGVAAAALLVLATGLAAVLFAVRPSIPGTASGNPQEQSSGLASSPAATSCQVPLRSRAALADLAIEVAGTVTPTAREIAPVATVEVPIGEPADPATLDGVTETIEAVAVCVNAGYNPVQLESFSDDFVRDAFASLVQTGLSADGIANVMATSVAERTEGTPAARLPLSVREARFLPDGRVGAVVAGLSVEDEELGVIFVADGDDWLIDELGMLVPAATIPPSASPESLGTVDALVVAQDQYFEPSRLEVPANTDVILGISNRGMSPHNFSIDALRVSVDVPPGESRILPLHVEPGNYEYYDNLPGHLAAGMTGTIIAN